MDTTRRYYYTNQPPPQQQPLHHLPPHYSHHEPPPPPVPLHRLHYHHRHHAPPHTSPSYPSRADHDDQVRTLFIAGLPDDVKNREIYHLFREFPGFVSSNLRPHSSNLQAFAFAVFADQQSAVVAMQAINGMVFDLEKGSTLYIEFAKSNSRSKRPRTGGERTGPGKKHRASLPFPRGSVESGPGSLHIPGMENSHYNMIDYPSAQSHLNVDGRGMFDASASRSNNSISSAIPQDNPPCPTLFVANLGPKCSEQELQHIFSRCRGYLKFKFQSAYGAPVAFVDFKDTACSTEALVQLRGTILHSSRPGEPMRFDAVQKLYGNRSIGHA